MLTERLQAVVNRVAELPKASQDELAEALEQLLNAYSPVDVNGSHPSGNHRPPDLRPELAAIVQQVMRDHAAMLKYLKDK